MKLLHTLSLLALICVPLTPSAKAQTPPPVDDKGKGAAQTSSQNKGQEVGDNEVVKINTSLVKVPVAVKDRDGRYIIDLKKENFSVYENGVEQQIAHFGGIDEPVTVVLLIDVSCSIKRPADTKMAALAFIDQLRPTDSVLPVAFGRNIYALLTESTRDRSLLRERIMGLPDNKQIPCDNGTRLGDAVEFVVNHILKNGRGRKAVILLSDGWDSRLSKPGWGPRTLQEVSELGVPFYSIRLVGDSHTLFHGYGIPGESQAEGAKIMFSNLDLTSYINQLSEVSGGRSFPMSWGEELKQDFEQIGEELRHQYMLAYYTNTVQAKSERREIKVRVNRRNVSVRARDSYLYVPPEK
jgi:Ca-activated chloride channel family protein